MKEKLKKIVLFQDLNDDIIENILKFTQSVKELKDNIIFYEGDEPEYLYLLVSGIVKLYKTTPNGKSIVLKYFQSGELIAEVANFEHFPYPATAASVTEVEILKIDFEKLKEIIYSNPNLSFQIQVSLIKKIKALESLITNTLVLNTKERVAKFIYDNTEIFFDKKNIEIAEILNMTPETYSRVLKELKDDGMIDLENKTVDKSQLRLMF